MAQRPASSGRGGWLTAGVLLLAVLANWPALDAGFVLDDRFVVAQDPRIRTLDEPWRFFQQGYWNVDPSVLDESGPPPLYRPLTSLSFAIEGAFFGATPRGYHVTNLVLHVLVTLLVIALARSWGWSAGAARFAGALFAVMAIHVEAVVQIIGRAELLAALFVLAMLLVHRRNGRFAGAVASLCFSVALLSKESAVVGLLLAVLGDLSGPRRAGSDGRARSPWVRYAGFVAVLGGVLWLRSSAIGLSTPDAHLRINPLQSLGSAERFVRGGHLLLQYATQCLLPVSLAAEYTPYGVRFIDWGSVGGWCLLPAWGLLGAVLWWWQRGTGSLRLSALWFVLAFSVTCNALVPIGTLMGDRLAYLPSVGIALLLTAPRRRVGRATGEQSSSSGGAFQSAGSRSVRFWVLLLAGGALLSVQLFCSLSYARQWSDDVRLLEVAARHVPRSQRNLELLAGAYVDRAQTSAKNGRFADALADAEHAVSLHEDGVLGRHVLAKLLLHEGRIQESVLHFQFVLHSVPAEHPLAVEARQYLQRMGALR